MPWWDPLTWDWATVAKTAFGAGAGTVLVQGFFAIYRDRRQRKAPAAYMAMRLAVVLEFYAAACSTFITNNTNTEREPDEEFPRWDSAMPELHPYPDDADGWRAIDRKLAGRCLNFPNKIHGSQLIIGSTIQYDMDDLGDTLDEQAAERGLVPRVVHSVGYNLFSLMRASAVVNCQSALA